MKVLLVGDYSSVHYYLFKGLQECGIDAAFISTGDGVKNIPVASRWNVSSYKRLEKLIGVNGKDFIEKNWDEISSFRGFDVVQIINPIMVEEASIKANIQLFEYLKKNNDKIFLYSCGDDLNWVRASLHGMFEDSMFGEKSLYLSKEMIHPLRYLLHPLIRRLCNRVYDKVDGIIPGSLDYMPSIPQVDKRRQLIPFPVDFSSFPYAQVSKKDRYEIVHGFQPGKCIRKGDKYFESAIKEMTFNYEYCKVGGLPFSEYVLRLQQGDIFFDQTNSRDQGMNAIFAMATGKVVFSGFSPEFYDHYKLKNEVGVNARPSVDWLKSKLTDIRDGVIDVGEISYRSRSFVEEYHDFRVVAERFVKEWSA